MVDIVERTCKACLRSFPLKGNGRGVFCSVECFRRYMAAKPTEYRRVEYADLVCHACGKTFQRRKAEVRVGYHYCTQSCAGKVTGRLPKRMPRRPPVPKTCEVCGADFLARATQIRPRFCSRACDSSFRSSHMVGAANPNYRHGIDQRSALATAKRNYPWSCAVCGWVIILEVHHILPKSKGGNNHPENLILLCPNHHEMAQQGMIPTEELRAISARLRLRIPVGESGL